MTVTTTLHVNFRGNARQALEFYHSIFGGDVVLVPYGDAAAGQSEQIVWGQVLAPNGFHLMAYDVQEAKSWDPGVIPFYLALRGTDPDEITTLWNALAQSDGAVVDEPFGPSEFSPLYGKVTDRFGVTWIIDVMVAWS